MQEVLIQRCTLRVVRHGGWSWGADPKRLLQDVLGAVPWLVAARLAELLAEVPGDVAIAQPIQIRIPIRLDELRAYAHVDAATVARTRPRWVAQIDQALQEAIGAVEIASALQEPGAAGVFPEPSARVPVARILRDALTKWQRSGLLAFLVAAAQDRAVERWLSTLGSAAPAAAASSPAEVDGASRVGADSAVSGRASAATGAAAQLVEIVEALVSSTAAASPRAEPIERDNSPLAASESPGVTVLPRREEGPQAEARPVDPGDHSEGAAPTSTLAAPPAAAARQPLVDADVRVSSALPWLLLVPLDRIGYLRMLRVALETAGIEPHSAMFGATLAYKLTGSADRAWQKTADAEHTAAVMAAQRNAVSKPELHRFAHRIAPHCPLLDAQIAHAICEGRRADDPWLLSSLEPGSVALIDPEGLFPAWWGLGAERGVDALRTSGGTELIVADDAADPRVLQHLADGGIRFLTTSRPGRGESWVRIGANDAPGWWSNVPGPVTARTRRWIAGAGDLLPRTRALTAEFGERRLAQPLHPTAPLEQSLSLAVSVALGTMAWELWHARESPDPLLALSRLGDLEARVRFTRYSVRVIVALGRRHRDLYDAGLLAPVRDVPWLDERTLEFSGG